MNQDWHEFLAAQGAQLEDGIVSHFGAAADERIATRDDTILCDLGQFGILRVSGEEAQTFLQNLLSNDIREVSNTRAQLSSLNNAKGRMLATMLIWRQGDDYLLQLPRLMCEPIRKKLTMYVLRAKVKISDASDEIVSIGVSGGVSGGMSGANAHDILQKQFGPRKFDKLPLSPLDIIDCSPASIMNINATRFQINIDVQHAPALWSALSQHARPVGSNSWNWLNIRSGIPIILPQTQEQFVAQMVNLDLIGGVNFKKGCYPGQEIVARTQYLGKLKRRMYLAHIETLAHIDTLAHLNSAESPQAGDELFSADMEGQASGMLVDAAPAPSGGYDVLAVVQISSRQTQVLHWKSLQGAALQFIQLPYPLPQDLPTSES